MEKKCVFPGLVPKDYMHPMEAQAVVDRELMGTVALGMDKLTEVCQTVCQQIILGKYVEITEARMPEICTVLRQVCRTLDFRHHVRLYLTHEYQTSCMQIGSERLCILIPDLLLERGDRDMLAFAFGNAVGMFKGGHIRLATVNAVLPSAPEMLPFRLPMQALQRAADMSSDRAGLLACQNIGAAIRCILWDLGLPPACVMDLNEEEALELADTYVEDLDRLWQGKLNRAAMVWKKWNGTVSPGHFRVAQLTQWYREGYPDLVARLGVTEAGEE